VSIYLVDNYLKVASMLQEEPINYNEFLFSAKHYFNSEIITKEFVNFSLEIGFLKKEKGDLSLEDEFLSLNLKKINKFKDKLLIRILKHIREFESYKEVFSPENLSFQSNYGAYSISKNAFGLKHTNLMTLLLNFGFMKKIESADRIFFLLETKYLEKSRDKNKKISPEELKRLLELKERLGIEAEEFVFNYETNRLQNKNVHWISKMSANEGYDIASFNSPNETIFSRLIEVKSYRGESIYFHWSKNEINSAKSHRENYWLYLVNRDSMRNKDYIPEMIQNPYENVFLKENWKREASSWKFTNERKSDD